MSVESTLLYLSSHQACSTRGTSCPPAYAPAAAFEASASHPPVAVRSGVRWRRWRSRRWRAWREIFLDVTTASPTWLRRNSRDLLMWAQFFWFHLQCDLCWITLTLNSPSCWHGSGAFSLWQASFSTAHCIWDGQGLAGCSWHLVGFEGRMSSCTNSTSTHSLVPDPSSEFL